MTRVVVIGDSQAGAFKEGWATVAPKYPDLDLEVFAAPFPNFSRLRLTQSLDFGFPPADAAGAGSELAERINGRASINLADADAVLWAGYQTGFGAVQRLLAEADVDGLRDADAPQRMSAAAFSAVADALARRSVPPPPWRGWTSPALILAACPLVAEGCRASHLSRFSVAQTLARNPQGVLAALGAYSEAFERALAPHNITLLPQPPQTITPEALTAGSFSRGSRQVVNSALHPEHDYVHMNAGYGAACIAALATKLRTIVRPAAQLAGT